MFNTKVLEHPHLWCIIGPSGSGKTHLANSIAKVDGFHIICSYTTRPMRDGEVEGVDHHFISVEQYEEMKQTNPEGFLAYTYFGGHHYFALHSQVKDDMINLYVIDEVGYYAIANRFSEIYNIFTLNVHTSECVRIKRGISQERIQRDHNRLPMNMYTYRILNDSDMFAFEEQIDRVVNVMECMQIFHRKHEKSLCPLCYHKHSSLVDAPCTIFQDEARCAVCSEFYSRKLADSVDRKYVRKNG